MNILHIDSSINGEFSLSRQLTAEVVRQLASDRVVYRDVVKTPIAHLTGTVAAGFRPLRIATDATAEDVREHELSEALVNEFQ